MPLVNINPLLKATVLDHLKKAQSSLFSLDVQIYSSENPDKSHIVKPLYIKNYTIKQLFTQKYTDEITLSLETTPEDFFKIYQNRQNLWCSLVAYPFLESTRDIDTSTQVKEADVLSISLSENNGWVHTYRAILINIGDITKQFNINQIQKTEENNMTDNIQSQTIRYDLQLIQEDIYNIRSKSFQLPLRNTTIKKAIYAAANTLGISNINLYEPDNKNTYTHLTFPPMQTLESFIPMLQKSPGIYKEGCEYYFTNHTLYVYPGYKVDLNRQEPVVNIYKVPANMFPGLFGYHSKDEDGNLHIVSDTETEVNDTANASLENVGNQFMTLNSENTLDLARSVNGKIGNFNQNLMMTIGMENIEGNTKSKFKTTFVQGSSNPFLMASNMIKDNKISVTLGWHNPTPYLIIPGQRCIYHYEDQEGYKTRVGIIDDIVYSFEVNSKTTEYVYRGTAVITLRLASDSEQLVNSNDDNLDTQSNNNSIIDFLSDDFSLSKLKSWLS